MQGPSSGSLYSSISNPGKEPDELVRFREAWKAEVQQKATAQRGTATSSLGLTILASEAAVGTQEQPAEGIGVATLRNAVEIYRQAVQCEQTSQLDDALRLYRQAFRMDSHVDKAYHKEEKRLESITTFNTPLPVASGPVDGLLPHITSAISLKPAQHVQVTGTLSSLIDTFPPELEFLPEDEREPALLSTLPDELLVLILHKLDHSTIERFASVNRKARVITLDSEIWK
jgi:F-box protein 9